MSKDLEGYNNPTEDNFNSAGTPSRADCEGTIVNSPYNKPRVKYDRAESLNIHRSPSVADSHLSKLTRGK